mmetsp:Transcript_43381/g.101280  ORF Transcript_43381/g.101280 Transcript_43381/m.101280 type:complete len:154 (+) Transcript_43381:24-485(+)
MGICQVCGTRPNAQTDMLPPPRGEERAADEAEVRQEKLREVPSLQRPRGEAAVAPVQQPASFQVKSEKAVERRRQEEQRERRLLKEQAAATQPTEAKAEEKLQDSGWTSRLESGKLAQAYKPEEVPPHGAPGVQPKNQEKLQEKARPSVHAPA